MGLAGDLISQRPANLMINAGAGAGVGVGVGVGLLH
ncbi:hypothetical protein ONO86_02461 [Micromonospora noduli]|nr:hypothetical protein ONO86_02461 [Micromonospora noduli]